MLAEQLNTAFPKLEERLDASFSEIRSQVAQLESQVYLLQQSGESLAATVATVSAALASLRADDEATPCGVSRSLPFFPRSPSASVRLLVPLPLGPGAFRRFSLFHLAMLLSDVACPVPSCTRSTSRPGLLARHMRESRSSSHAAFRRRLSANPSELQPTLSSRGLMVCARSGCGFFSTATAVRRHARSCLSSAGTASQGPAAPLFLPASAAAYAQHEAAPSSSPSSAAFRWCLQRPGYAFHFLRDNRIRTTPATCRSLPAALLDVETELWEMAASTRGELASAAAFDALLLFAACTKYPHQSGASSSQVSRECARRLRLWSDGDLDSLLREAVAASAPRGRGQPRSSAAWLHGRATELVRVQRHGTIILRIILHLNSNSSCSVFLAFWSPTGTTEICNFIHFNPGTPGPVCGRWYAGIRRPPGSAVAASHQCANVPLHHLIGHTLTTPHLPNPIRACRMGFTSRKSKAKQQEWSEAGTAEDPGRRGRTRLAEQSNVDHLHAKLHEAAERIMTLRGDVDRQRQAKRDIKTELADARQQLQDLQRQVANLQRKVTYHASKADQARALAADSDEGECTDDSEEDDEEEAAEENAESQPKKKRQRRAIGRYPKSANVNVEDLQSKAFVQ